MQEIHESRTKELAESVFRFYSIGVVAANKKRGSFLIEVSPIEKLSMSDGELTDFAEDLEADGQDSSGRAYSAKAKLSATIQAEWLPFEQTNRRTAPDVRRGEEVMLYQIADVQDVIYWTTFKDCFNLRRLETVRYMFQADPNNPPSEDYSNCYGIEISTHEKHITLRTSASNGEPFIYTIQINTEDGRLVITDDVDNAFSIVSGDSLVEMRNANGCFLKFEGDDVYLNVVNNLHRTIGGSVSNEVSGSVSSEVGDSVSTKAGSSVTTSSPTITEDAAAINLDGNVSSGDGSHGGAGNVTMNGDVSITGVIEAEQGANFGGVVHAKKIISDEAISAPNV